MLSHVRVHPLLVTATKEKELLRERLAPWHDLFGLPLWFLLVRIVQCSLLYFDKIIVKSYFAASGIDSMLLNYEICTSVIILFVFHFTL